MNLISEVVIKPKETFKAWEPPKRGYFDPKMVQIAKKVAFIALKVILMAGLAAAVIFFPPAAPILFVVGAVTGLTTTCAAIVKMKFPEKCEKLDLVPFLTGSSIFAGASGIELTLNLILGIINPLFIIPAISAFATTYLLHLKIENLQSQDWDTDLSNEEFSPNDVLYHN